MEKVPEETKTKLRIDIPSYKESEYDKAIILYVINVLKKGDEKTYSVEKRYSEFDELNDQLSKIFKDLPKFPPKTYFFKLKEPNELETRRKNLEVFLKGIVARPELVNSEPLIRFLQLQRITPDLLVSPPQLLGQLKGFIHGVRDYIYIWEKDILFILLSDMNVASRIDSYLTNMKLPWEKPDPKAPIISVGALGCYTKVKDWKFKKLWKKLFSAQAICLYWDEITNLLGIGLDDGTIMCLKVPTELGYKTNEEVFTAKVHAERIMQIHIDPAKEYIYSISHDKYLKTFHLVKREVVYQLLLGEARLNNFVVDTVGKRGFVANNDGFIFIIDFNFNDPRLIETVRTNGQCCIRSLIFDSTKNYLFAGGFDDGEIAMFDTGKPGKEKYSKQTASFKSRPKIRSIQWSSSKSELYAGSEDGCITFWNATLMTPIYVLQAHEKDITKMQWNESSSILITSSKDRTLKFWQIPSEWKAKALQIIEQDSLSQKKLESQVKKTTEEKVGDEEEDDDLANWHKE